MRKAVACRPLTAKVLVQFQAIPRESDSETSFLQQALRFPVSVSALRFPVSVSALRFPVSVSALRFPVSVLFG